MPQIWLTYDELGELIGCNAAAARTTAGAMPLDRRKCHDGHTRAKLNALLTESFLDRLAQHWIDRELAACAGDLRAVRELMRSRRHGTVQNASLPASAAMAS